ncbi:MAG: RsmD family RNA methyltransferase [Candidatus Competibacteraceae bacterium]|nr:RsmD family RNA methyltransferase [Candidatus Competibacteraceae bacterium]
MRIIGGTLKGRTLVVPKGLPVRPTTDFAREAIFNILSHHFDIHTISFLDLFAGTGAMSFEMASRGAHQIITVDQHAGCIRFIQSIAQQWNLKLIPIRSEVLRFAQKINQTFDLVFADPPYHTTDYHQLVDSLLLANILKPEAWLIIEHPPTIHFNHYTHFIRHLRYGNVNFSIFQSPSNPST